MTALRHLPDRFKHGANICIFVAVDRAHVRADGIDHDKANIAYPVECLLQEGQIRLQIESPQSVVIANGRNYEGALAICPSGVKTRNDCVCNTVFG
jgi:hypothetical protein